MLFYFIESDTNEIEVRLENVWNICLLLYLTQNQHKQMLFTVSLMSRGNFLHKLNFFLHSNINIFKYSVCASKSDGWRAYDI